MNSIRIRSAVLLALVCLLYGGVSPAQTTYYLSPTGNDSTGAGSSVSPWKTLAKARDEVQKIATFTGDVTVVLKNGTYELAETFTLTAADSGKDGHDVIYKAENAGMAVISGGTTVTGWTASSNSNLPGGTTGVFEASVPAGSDSRQLYVNDARATRARSTSGSGWSRRNNGYNTPSGVASWHRPQDIELIFYFRWKMYRGSVASVSGRVATMDANFFNGSALEPFGLPGQSAIVRWVENNLALLNEEGEWYLDTGANKLYYKPKSSESLTGGSAVSVVLPRLETLVRGTGVSNVRFEGLVFSHATWLFPSGNLGYLGVQAGVTMRDVDYANIEDAFEGMVAMPGNLHFTHSSNIVFSGNTFEHLGASAIAFGRGSKTNTVFNNTFDDISGAAIVVGNVQDHHPENYRDVVKDNLVDNNLIQNTGEEFYDIAAITNLWATRTVIINNTVEDTPYTGLSLGWGWGRYDIVEFPGFRIDNSGKAYSEHTQLKETLTLYNKIVRSMQTLYDGGGIYNLGTNLNSRITGNVITGARSAPDNAMGIYMDNNTTGFQVNDNVMYNMGGFTSNVHTVRIGRYNTIQDNDNSRTSSNYNTGTHKGVNGYYTNIVNAAGQQAEAARTERTVAAIVAGLPAALPLPEGERPPDYGLVVGKTASASESPETAGNAIDANETTYWDAGEGTRSGWWQVDLGQAYDVEYITIAFGKVAADKSLGYIRKDITFGIKTSLDGATFADQTFYTTTGVNVTIPANTKTYKTRQAINAMLITGTPSARYVRIDVTNSHNQDFGILRVKVEGEVSLGTNLATSGTASQSSTYSGWAASRAIDGDTNGASSGNSIAHTNAESQPRWTLDLRASKDIDSIRIWNRTDCCQDRLADFHVFVSDLEFGSAVTTVAHAQALSGVFDYHHSETAGRPTHIPVKRVGRYVRVQLAGTSASLALAEVQVYGSDPVNWTRATGVTVAATQSSTAEISGANWVASRAIDGNTNGHRHGNSLSHTDVTDSQPWWTVDLGAVRNIGTIKVWNRTDLNTDRLSDFHVFVSDVAFTGTTVASSQRQTGVYDYHHCGTGGEVSEIPVGRTGRYVRVQKSDATPGNENVLVMAEVQVFAP